MWNVFNFNLGCAEVAATCYSADGRITNLSVMFDCATKQVLMFVCHIVLGRSREAIVAKLSAN